MANKSTKTVLISFLMAITDISFFFLLYGSNGELHSHVELPEGSCQSFLLCFFCSFDLPERPKKSGQNRRLPHQNGGLPIGDGSGPGLLILVFGCNGGQFHSSKR